jgi:hypothetical protein
MPALEPKCHAGAVPKSTAAELRSRRLHRTIPATRIRARCSFARRADVSAGVSTRSVPHTGARALRLWWGPGGVANQHAILGSFSSPDVRVRSRATRRLSLRPTNIGNVSGRRVWIATDRRLFLADRARGSRPVQLVRSVEYPQITALSYKQSGEDHTRVELRLGSEQLDLRLETEEAKGAAGDSLPANRSARSASGFALGRLALQHRPAHPARAGALTSCP